MTIDEFRKLAPEIPAAVEPPLPKHENHSRRYRAFWKNAFSKVG
jgi:hypothetical protein